MSRVLLKNGYVVTVNSDRTVFPGGFIEVDGAMIVGVGASSATPNSANFDEVIDLSGCIVLPGLINCHQHHWYTLFKGLADGYLLEDWVTEFLLPLTHHLPVEGMRASSYVSAMEMLSTGTTCSLNHSVTTTPPEMVRATIEPQIELGIRQVFAKELRCRTPGNQHHPLTLDESLAAFEQEFNQWNGKADGRVRMAMVIESNAHWVAAGMTTEELICRGYELARKLKTKISTHIAGGTFSIEKGFLRYLRETGRTDVRYLMQLGLLDPHWVLIHGIHVTELDIEHMARVGCSFVYTPTSESLRGGGIGPFANARRAGVNVALGTDGPMVDYSVDMVEQMKACMLMQHVRHLDPTRMPVERTIEMATINAAMALGLDRELGSLEKGKRADIAVFNIDKPYVGVLHRPISTFICAGKGSDARLVMVDGKTVYRDGAFSRFKDSNRAIVDAEKIGKKVLAEAGLSARTEPAWRQ
jgi:5-methylthioadenosine/S-adenosylhomocysteine deaminase